ncbi:CHAD domain-containing protein [Microlunatus sp. Y2014]|uniref:CYTH and CHAD domain-containing protein n=1 Tax=Microlunatus sp. Y2014 TaxID=3418488 RepID=UPI003DA75F7A
MERKFEVSGGLPLPALDDVVDVVTVDDPVVHELEATYFDTADLALATAGVTLRRRTGGEDSGWHLKLPAGPDTRHEIRLPLGRALRTVPKALRIAVQLYARGAALVPVATLGTRRTVHRLRDADGAVLAEVSDDEVTADTSVPATEQSAAIESSTKWREWEAELVDGKRRHLKGASRMLTDAGAVPARSLSKLDRALGERAPVVRHDPPAPVPEGAAAVVHARLRQQVAELKLQDPFVRRDAEESVHDMRVAMRRLRSALATFRPLFDRTRTEQLREELKWIAGVLGEARDAEVMELRLRDLVSEQPAELIIGPVRQRIDDLATRYREAHDRSVEAMQSPRYLELVDRLDELVAHTPWASAVDGDADELLLGLVKHDDKRLRQRVSAAAAATDRTTRNELLHEVRKAAKRARYAAETVESRYGEAATSYATAVKDVQSVLGDQHDAAVTLPVLTELAERARAAGEDTFTFGRLHALEEARADALVAAYDDVWASARKKKLRRWLR